MVLTMSGQPSKLEVKPKKSIRREETRRREMNMRVSAPIAFALSALLCLCGCATQPKTSTGQDISSEIAEDLKPVAIEEVQLGPGDVIEISV